MGNLGYEEDVKNWAVQDQTQNPDLPEFYDLRQEQSGCFVPPVDQGQCGSCWSFSVANTISDAYAIRNAKANGKKSCSQQTNLSEEDLLNCSTAVAKGALCAGGDIGTALKQVMDNGLTTEKCNPYGHGSGTDSLGQGEVCPAKCFGEGSLSNKVQSESKFCVDSDNGATDPFGSTCADQAGTPGWCGLNNDDDFKSEEMCCACKFRYIDRLTTTAEIQAYLVEQGPMAVGIPVYKHLFNITSGIYQPQAGQGASEGGHAIECVGWGHDEDGQGFWIMKNSWGCSFGDDGQYKQSWAFNSETSFSGIKISGTQSFTNDVPLDEEPECKVPEDSNNADHCKAYNEFGKCKMCNSAYELKADNSCKLKDEAVDSHSGTADDDGESIQEEVFWQSCESAGGKGWLCPQENTCWTLTDGQQVECSTWIDIVAQNKIDTMCFRCPAPGIANCGTQSGEVCLQCNPGYSVSAAQDVCLKNSCAAAEESTADGDCVAPVPNCTPGSTVKTTAGAVCSACKPGFKLDAGHCMDLPDPEHCKEVTMTNPERLCEVCKDGQFVGPYGKCHPNEESGDGCKDSDNGAKDAYGDGCAAYNQNVAWCGGYDTADFHSMSMCCGCKAKAAAVKRSKALKEHKKHTASTTKTRQSKRKAKPTKTARKAKKATKKSNSNPKKVNNKKKRVNRQKLSKK